MNYLCAILHPEEGINSPDITSKSITNIKDFFHKNQVQYTI
jgi:hypothetical protein